MPWSRSVARPVDADEIHQMVGTKVFRHYAGLLLDSARETEGAGRRTRVSPAPLGFGWKRRRTDPRRTHNSRRRKQLRDGVENRTRIPLTPPSGEGFSPGESSRLAPLCRRGLSVPGAPGETKGLGCPPAPSLSRPKHPGPAGRSAASSPRPSASGGSVSRLPGHFPRGCRWLRLSVARPLHSLLPVAPSFGCQAASLPTVGGPVSRSSSRIDRAASGLVAPSLHVRRGDETASQRGV